MEKEEFVNEIESKSQEELVDEAIWLIRKANLSIDKWQDMVTDVLSAEYLADLLTDSVINWDEETLENFVINWNQRLKESDNDGRKWKMAYEILMNYGERRFGDKFWPGNDEEFVRRMEEEANISV